MLNKYDYLDVFAYIEEMAYTISAEYKRNFICAYITEAYKQLNVKLENIKASLSTINYRYRQSENKTDEYLLKELNDEFSYIHVKFEKDDSFKGRLKYPISGIISAEADPFDDILVIISDRFLDIIKNLNKDINDRAINNLVEDLMKIYSHEYTHLNQFDRQNILINGIDKQEITDNYKIKKYLSHPREIDAHARETAVELLLSGKSVKELSEMLIDITKEEMLISLSRIYGMYWSSFNKFNTYKLKNDNEIFNKYKKKILEFLQQDKNTINKNSLIFMLKSKQKN